MFDNAVQFIIRAMSDQEDNLQHQQQLQVLLAALAEFLKGIVLELRPKFLMDGNSMMALMKCNVSDRFPRPVAQTIHRTIFSCILLSWRNVAHQEQPRRIALAEEYVRQISQPILVASASNLPEAITNLDIFQDILEFFVNENSFAKQILVQSLRPITEKTFCIFKTFHIQDIRVLERILSFFHSLLRTLQTQLSADVVKELILVFIERCKKAQAAAINAMVLNYLLKIFLNIIKQHTHSSFVLLADIVKLSVQEVAPILFSSPTDESLLHLYAVFDAILQVILRHLVAKI